MLHSAPIQNKPKAFPLAGFNTQPGNTSSPLSQSKSSHDNEAALAAKKTKDASAVKEIQKNKISGTAARLISLTQDLTKLLREETALLEQNQVADISPLQNEKVRLTAKYEAERNVVRLNPSVLGPKDSMARIKLKEVTKLFQDEIVKHGKTLIRMKSITEGMVESINSAVSKKRPTAQQYNSMAGMHNSRGLRPNAIAINEVI